MPKLTGVEDTFLTKLDSDADSLINGHKGNMDRLCEVVSGMTKVMISTLRAGGPTWQECQEFRETTTELITSQGNKSFVDWKSTCVICVTVGGLIWKFWG